MTHNDLRERSLKAIREEVSWVPKWGRERIYGMIENRPDWCISRQRSWGVPIIVFHCQACGEHVLTPEMSASVCEVFKTEGADAWFERTPAELLGGKDACPLCGAQELAKGEDILDVWFDSGCSQAAVLEPRPELTWPADMYLEGSDQHRGWFHSSLLCAEGTRQAPPYKMVLTHGFVVDGEGRKMSKSVGNTIMPKKVIDRYGAEILRLWVAAEDYTMDIRLSEEILKQLAEAYRRIRNTMRFLLGNLSDFDPAADAVDPAEMLEMDRLMLHKTGELAQRLTKAYQEFAYHRVFQDVHKFCTGDLSGFYLDVLKDRLYTSAPRSLARRSAQTVLHRIASALVAFLAPIMSFTAEEIWDHLPVAGEKAASVHMTLFPSPDDFPRDAELAAKWDKLLAARDWVNVGLDRRRKEKAFGNSLDAKLIIEDSKATALLKDNAAILAEICMVSELAFAPAVTPLVEPGEAGEDEAEYRFAYDLEPTAWDKCPRCWKRRPEVGEAEICADCAQALEEL